VFCEFEIPDFDVRKECVMGLDGPRSWKRRICFLGLVHGWSRVGGGGKWERRVINLLHLANFKYLSLPKYKIDSERKD
jgi:hypothetical protein